MPLACIFKSKGLNSLMLSNIWKWFLHLNVFIGIIYVKLQRYKVQSYTKFTIQLLRI